MTTLNQLTPQEREALNILRAIEEIEKRGNWSGRKPTGRKKTYPKRFSRRGNILVKFPIGEFQKKDGTRDEIYLCVCLVCRRPYADTRKRLITNPASCGCLRRLAHIKHGMSGTKIYRVWLNMLARCENFDNPDFEYYGGRGIRVCPRWLDFKNFFEDMGEPEEGKTIERIDNDKGYSKENCRWATRAEQQQNTRARR